MFYDSRGVPTTRGFRMYVSVRDSNHDVRECTWRPCTGDVGRKKIRVFSKSLKYSERLRRKYVLEWLIL